MFRIRFGRAWPAAAAALALLAATAVAGTLYTNRKVEYVNDGDTIKVYPAISGTVTSRLLGIDSPEKDGDTQEPWATDATNHLKSLLKARTVIDIETDAEEFDIYDRLLGHIYRASDHLNTNQEQLRMGHAVTYVIWPNLAHFEEYRTAQQEAQENGRGIWDPDNPLTELPFEYRLRINGDQPSKPVGDYYTMKYVEPADYHLVHVNNRVFFWNESDAQAAGFTPCPQDADGNYDPACFSSGS